MDSADTSESMRITHLITKSQLKPLQHILKLVNEGTKSSVEGLGFALWIDFWQLNKYICTLLCIYSFYIGAYI